MGWRLFSILHGLSVLCFIGLSVWMWYDTETIDAIVAGISFMCFVMSVINSCMAIYYWKLGTIVPDEPTEKVNWKKEGF